jgi:hypothetical protein
MERVRKEILYKKCKEVGNESHLDSMFQRQQTVNDYCPRDYTDSQCPQSVSKKVIKKGKTRVRVSRRQTSKASGRLSWIFGQKHKTTMTSPGRKIELEYRPCFEPGVSYPTKTRPRGGSPMPTEDADVESLLTLTELTEGNEGLLFKSMIGLGSDGVLANPVANKHPELASARYQAFV